MSCPVCRKNHRGLCHVCPHQPDVQAGKYRDRVFCKTPCSGCRLSDAPPSGRYLSPYHFDESRHAAVSEPSIEISSDERSEFLTKVGSFFTQWLTLSPQEQLVTAWRLANPDLPIMDFAKSRRIKPQNAHRSLRIARQKMPMLNRMFYQYCGYVIDKHVGNKVVHKTRPRSTPDDALRAVRESAARMGFDIVARYSIQVQPITA